MKYGDTPLAGGLDWDKANGSSPTKDGALNSIDTIINEFETIYKSIPTLFNTADRAIDTAIDANSTAADYDYIANKLDSDDPKGAKAQIDSFNEALLKFRGLLAGLNKYVDEQIADVKSKLPAKKSKAKEDLLDKDGNFNGSKSDLATLLAK